MPRVDTHHFHHFAPLVAKVGKWEKGSGHTTFATSPYGEWQKWYGSSGSAPLPRTYADSPCCPPQLANLYNLEPRT